MGINTTIHVTSSVAAGITSETIKSFEKDCHSRYTTCIGSSRFETLKHNYVQSVLSQCRSVSSFMVGENAASRT